MNCEWMIQEVLEELRSMTRMYESAKKRCEGEEENFKDVYHTNDKFEATKNGISPGKGCPSAIGKAIKKLSEEFKKEYLGKTENIIKQEEKQTSKSPKCTNCGAEMQMTGGCNVCPECGASKCD